MSQIMVKDVKELVVRGEAAWGVLLLHYPKALHTQYLTYGVGPEHKIDASDMGEEIAAWVDKGGSTVLSPAPGTKRVIESFVLDAAKNKAEVERLTGLLGKIASILDGVTPARGSYADALACVYKLVEPELHREPPATLQFPEATA